MLELRDLGLTLKQMEEARAADPLLVLAWLERCDDDTIENPAAWFLTGIRSGISPHQLGDGHRASAIRRAERYVSNILLLLDREEAVLDELFEDRTGILHRYRDEEPLREKMLTLWRLERPYGEQAERDAIERARRWRESKEAASA